MQVRHTVKASDQPCPRVMAASRQRVVASVDRGVHRLGIELRNHPRGCRPCCLMGKAVWAIVISPVIVRPTGVRDPMHVHTLFVRNPGDPRIGQRLDAGPVKEGLWPNASYVRSWEVGPVRSTEEVREQSGLNSYGCRLRRSEWRKGAGARGE